jgi:hypothetical protein
LVACVSYGDCEDREKAVTVKDGREEGMKEEG